VKPLILTLVFAVIATTIGAGWAITQFHSRLFSSTETDQNLIAYKQLGKAIGLTLDEFAHQDDFVAHWKAKNNIEISFQERSEFQVPSDIAEEFQSGVPLLLESEGELSLHIYMRNTVQVMSMLSPIKRNARQSLLNFLLTLLFYWVVITVLLAWLYPLIKRLVMLQKAANLFGAGELSSRVRLSNFSYISSIEKEFNRMANQIQKLVDDNQLLSRAVSHNLKTPITRLRMGVDVLEEAKSKSEVNRYIKRINTDLDEMQSLVETLLQYSKLDEFKIRLNKEHIDLCQFIPKLIENENASNVSIVTNFSENRIVVNTDPQYLAMSLVNILSNASKHASSVVEVRVELDTSDKNKPVVSIFVEDDGKGISETDALNVKKPFWRGDNHPAIKGHGMGLAIAERIAQWLTAELVIKSSARLGGASVGLVFGKQ